MPQSNGNDELARLTQRMRELQAEAEVIEHRIDELNSKERGVIDDTALLTVVFENTRHLAEESLHAASV
jgi:hypothetical protein